MSLVLRSGMGPLGLHIKACLFLVGLVPRAALFRQSPLTWSIGVGYVLSAP